MVAWILVVFLCRAVVAHSDFFFDQSNSVPVSNPRTLIALPHMVQKSKYNTFFSTIKNRGHAIEFKLCRDKTIKLTPNGQRSYENAIIFCSKSKTVGELGQQAFVKFVNKGGNLLIVVNGDYSDTWRKLGLELGLRIHQRSSKVLDHFHHDVATKEIDRTMVLSTNWLNSVFDSISAPVLYNGLGISVRKKATWSFGLLRASAYGLSVNGKKEDGVESSGSDTILAGALETRNGARATFVGSSDVFSDEFFNRQVQRAQDGKRFPLSGNEAFTDQLGQWTFGERGYLKAFNRRHHQKNSDHINPVTYRIADDIEYHFTLKEWRDNEWVGYEADDVQFEFSRLDAFIRRIATHEGKGHYSVKFKVPDTMGVYKFYIKYFRRGYTSLNFFDEVSVRPFAHDEYDRFLIVATPYYVGAFSMLTGFLFFSWVFVHHKGKADKKED